MIVTALHRANAAQELRQDALPDRPQPRTRGRVVEHADHARRPPWAEALRRVPQEPRHRAQHADAAAQCPGRSRHAGTAPLQRAPAARRICSDRPRTRFPSGSAFAARLGKPALCAGGSERAAARRRNRCRRRSDPRRSRHRTADHRIRPPACARPRRTRADTVAVRITDVATTPEKRRIATAVPQEREACHERRRCRIRAGPTRPGPVEAVPAVAHGHARACCCMGRSFPRCCGWPRRTSW